MCKGQWIEKCTHRHTHTYNVIYMATILLYMAAYYLLHLPIAFVVSSGAKITVGGRVYVFVCKITLSLSLSHSHTHTHTHFFILCIPSSL